MSNKENLCAVCNSVAKQKCSACQDIYYCNREHQKMHWKLHSKKCQPCKLAVNAQLGRHFVATRDIKVGEVVLKEKKPLVEGPLSNKPICLGCGDSLTKDKSKPCIKCGWPLCINCKKHGAECEFTLKYRGAKVSITEYENIQPIYESILLVRALALRESNPAAYRELMSLEDHSVKIKTKPNVLIPPDMMAALVKHFYKHVDVAQSEIAKIFAILQINAHATDEKALFAAVYGKSSYVEHNCRPNCSKTIDADGGIIMRAVVPISKGDHISISYVKLLWSTRKRRTVLSFTKFFDCICERCKDPTEFGTMFSAFKCIKDGCTGFLFPPTFLLPETCPDYVCRECNSIMSWKAAVKLESELYALLPDSPDTTSNFLPETARNEIIQRYGKMLHENHFFKVSIDLLREPLISDINTSDQLLRSHIADLRKIVQISEILATADYFLRGNSIFLLIQFIITWDLRQPQKKKSESSIAELKKLIEKMYKLVHRDPKNGQDIILTMESLAAMHFSKFA